MKNFQFPISNFQKNRGVISIATMLVLGAVVVQIGLVGFILSYYLTTANAGVKLSSYAFSAASAGIEEGVLRIIRSDYPNGFAISVPAPMGSEVYVMICKGGTPPPGDPEIPPCEPEVTELSADKVQITSRAKAFNKATILVAIVEVDPITHAVRVESITEKYQL